MILLGYGDYLAHRGKLQQLVDQATPFVRWGAVLPGQPGLSIGCDNLAGGHQAGSHLLAAGRRRIAFLGDASIHFPEFLDRYRGCDAALYEAGASLDPALQVDAESSEDSGYAAAQELLRRERPFDAVFAASDLIAIGAMRAFAERGLRVPEDVAMVGFDDVPPAAWPAYNLTSFRQRVEQMVAETVTMLLARIDGDESGSPHVVLPGELVIRGSTRRYGAKG